MAENDIPSGLAPGGGVNHGVGGRLRVAREAMGSSLAQMSGQTKIPVRMLELIEAGKFAALPARIYVTGFTRSYARALGLDEQEILAALRLEISMDAVAETHLTQSFEPGDPARVPTARFAWLAAVAALVVFAAGLLLWRTYYAPSVSLPSMLPIDAASSTAVPTPAPPPGLADPLATMVPTVGTMPAGAAIGPDTRSASPGANTRQPMVRRMAPAAAEQFAAPTAVPLVAPPAAIQSGTAPAPASTAQN